MWKKIKNSEYKILLPYFIIGLILAVIIYQFITMSLQTHKLLFSSITEKKTLSLIFSSVIGGFVGLLTALIISNKDREARDNKLWGYIKNKKKSLIIYTNILAFSLGGFVFLIIENIFELDSYNNFFQNLFSYKNIISYTGIIISAAVFAIIFTFGIIKRLKKLYS